MIKVQTQGSYNKLVKLKKVFLFLFCPLKSRPLKTCKKDISKIITAGSFKLGQLIENLVKFLKTLLCVPFADMDILVIRISHKIIIARSFKFSILMRDGV